MNSPLDDQDLLHLEQLINDCCDDPQSIPGSQRQALTRIRSKLDQLLTSTAVSPLPNPTIQPEKDLELQRLLEENQRHKALLEAIFDADPSGVAVLVGEDLLFAYTNPAYRFICPDPIQDPVGKTYDAVWPQRSKHGNRSRFRKVLATGQPFQTQGISHCFPDQTERIFTLQARRIEWGEQGPAVLVLMWDVTEQFQARQLAEQERAQLQAVLEALPVGVVILDREGGILTSNPACTQIWGGVPPTTASVAEYTAFQAWWVDGDRHVQPDEWAPARAVRSGEAVIGQEMRIQRFDGRPAVILNSAVPVRDSRGEITGCVVAIVDITERREMEDALRQALQAASQSEALLEAFFAHSPGILNIEDEEFRYLKTDLLTPTYFGLDRQSIVGKAVEDLAPEFIEQFGPMMRRVLETGQPELNQEVFSPVPGRAGEMAHWLANYFPVPLPGGKRGIGIMGVEITELKKTEKALRESEQLYRAIGESIDYGVWVCAPDGRNLYASPSYLNLVGITQQQCSDFGWGDSLHPDDAERTIAAWKECVRTGDKWDIEHRFRGVDGQYHPILARGVPVRNKQGDVIYWAGINLDISQFKQTEDALRESEARLRAVFQSLTEGVVVLNPQGEVVEINEAIEQTYGHSLLELQDPALDPRIAILRPDGTPFPVEEQPAILAIHTGQTIRNVELGVRLKNGQVSWRLVNAQPMYDDQGKLLGAVASLFDITERKQAEQSLRYYATLLDQLGDAVIASDANYRITAWNAAATQMYGWSVEEVLGQIGLDVLQTEFPQADKARMLDSIAQSGSYWGEATQVRKDGTRFPVEVHSVVLRDATGVIAGYLSVNQDITEHKLAEEAQRLSEEKFALAFANSPAAIALTTLEEGIFLDVNETWEALNGYRREEVIGKSARALPIWPTPEAAARFVQTLRENGSFRCEEQEFLNRSGQIFVAELSAEILTLQGKKLVLSTFVDITERVRAEEALKESEIKAQLQLVETNAAFEAMSDALLIFDREGEAIHANRAAIETYGFDPIERSTDAALKTLAIRTMSGEPVPLEALPNTRALIGERVVGEMYRFSGSQGQEYIVLASASPIYTADGQLNGAMALWHDITEQAQAEKQARETDARLEVQRRLIEQREQERLQIARDLHDGPVQEILGAMYALQGMFYDESDANVADGLKSISESLQRQVAELRAYAGELRPPTLSKFGLEKAIRSHAETFQEKHPQIQISIEATQEGELLPEEMRLALFRIYQEAMNNIAKHSPRANVKILFEKEDHVARLEVSDDGPGFEVPNDWLNLARSGHLGLVGMRERAEAICGTLEIESKAGKGTCIQVKVPIQTEYNQGLT